MSGEAGYHFLDGGYQSTLGKVYGSVNLDDHSHLSLSQLRALYMSESIDKQGVNPSYRDSCITAQFGYYDGTPAQVTSGPTSYKHGGFTLKITDIL